MSHYLMPAEWQPHSRCWMAWPCNEELWRGNIAQACNNYAAVANAIVNFEPVTILVRPEHQQSAQQLLNNRVELLPLELNDSWMRDFGPTFVIDQSTNTLAGVDWRFNGWGKFPHDLDQHVAQTLLKHLNIPIIGSNLINEGGAIHVDGLGTCMLTENVQRNKNRNGHLSRKQVEEKLQQAIGASHCIWFEQGLADDHTDGHVDQFACFTAPGKVVALTSSDPKDPNYARLKDNLDILSKAQDAKGNGLEITTIEQPPSEYKFGERLGKSYINFYLANNAVIMPSYGLSDYDTQAQATLARCFPTREVVPVDSQVLVTGGGNIHCITQQEPEYNRPA